MKEIEILNIQSDFYAKNPTQEEAEKFEEQDLYTEGINVGYIVGLYKDTTISDTKREQLIAAER